MEHFRSTTRLQSPMSIDLHHSHFLFTTNICDYAYWGSVMPHPGAVACPVLEVHSIEEYKVILNAPSACAGLSRLAGVLMLVLMSQAFAYDGEQTRSSTQIEMSGDALFLLGTFDDYTASETIAYLKCDPSIQTIVLTANGGSINDAETLRLGRYIRAQGLDTHLINNGVAASGGVSLLLAGNKRSVGSDAHLGVHAWAQCSGRTKVTCLPATEFEHGDIAHALHREYILEMLGTDDFYWFSIQAAEHDSIHWLSVTELSKFEIENIYNFTPPTLPFPDAFEQEYRDVCHNCP